MKEAIHTDRAPAAIGPYSQAVRAGGFLFTSGQIPVDPAAGDIPAGIKAQAQQSLNNIAAILAQAGLDRSAAGGDGVAVVTKAAPVSVVLAVIKIEVVHTGQTPLKFLSYFGFPLELWI